jgi:hypothetical protein
MSRAREGLGRLPPDRALRDAPHTASEITARTEEAVMTQADQNAGLKFVVTNTLIVRDIRRSVAFYRDVLGATVLREGEPALLRRQHLAHHQCRRRPDRRQA